MAWQSKIMFQPFTPEMSALFIVLVVWEVIWKGIALWKASKNDQLNWFAAIFLLNTVGILPIVYIKFFQKK